MSGRNLLPVMLLVTFVALFSTLGHAQYRGSLRGTVTDPQGAVVAGATVTLVNTDTNRTLVSTSDAKGIYQFNALEPAPYRLTLEAAGFKKKVLAHVRIIPEQLNALDLQLELGQVQDSITVSETTQTLDTETATVSGTITENQIHHVPSFGRDVLQLVRLAPGVFGDGAQGSGGGDANLPGTQGPGGTGGNAGIFRTENGPQALASGQQYENNSITIDGISTVSSVWGGTTIITPSQESVESVKVVSNSYDAEFGRFSGAQVQITSKGGTNQYHGSFFFTAHRPGLNAFQPFNPGGDKPLRDENLFNQLGGSVGGPIWKNKLFAFFSYETVRQPNSNISGNGWFDTSALAGMAPSGSIAAQYLSFPGNGVVSTGINPSACADAGLVENVNCRTIPGQGLDIGSPLKQALGTQDLGFTSSSNPGVGGGLDGVADIANFITSNPTTFSAAQYNGRLDAEVTGKDRIGFAIYYVPQSKDNFNGNRAYDIFHHTQINEAFSAIWNRTFSPTLLNEFRVNAAGWRWNEVASNPQSPVGLPTDRIDTIGNITINPFGPNVGSILNQWTYGYKDVATKVVGRHTVKFGGDITRLFYLSQCVGCGVPSYNFFNLWDFLNDAPHNEGGSFDPHTGLPSTFRQDFRSTVWGFFVQDDLKLRRNLTLNLGLRWSYFSPLRAKQDNMFVATPGAGANFLTGLTVAKRGSSWNAQKDNFGPQIGFAWSPDRFHDKLVVRGGYGLSYNQFEIAVSAGINGNPGLFIFPSLNMSTPTSPNPGIVYAVSSDVHSFGGYPANPNTIVSFGPNGLPTTGQVNVTLFPTDLPTMRVHHYSLDVQYDLGHNLMASLGYQGSVSRNLYLHQNPNAAPAANGLTLNPQIGGGDFWSVSGRGNYNALLAELRHQFSHQFMADAQFVWAKSMDTASSPYSSTHAPFNLPFYPFDPGANYGRSEYNVGKAFKLYGVWQPVLFHGNSWLEKIAGGWSISAIFTVHSGFPWTPLVSFDGSLYCGTCGYSVLPAVYLGGAGTSTSNDAFKTGSNFSKGAQAFFAFPSFTAFSGTNSGSALPQVIQRNSFNGPGYRDVDMTLAKAFGLPNAPVLGENAKIEFRMDVYNIFNNLNFNPTSISNNIGSPGVSNPNFGKATAAFGGRVVTLGARFNF